MLKMGDEANILIRPGYAKLQAIANLLDDSHKAFYLVSVGLWINERPFNGQLRRVCYQRASFNVQNYEYMALKKTALIDKLQRIFTFH